MMVSFHICSPLRQPSLPLISRSNCNLPSSESWKGGSNNRALEEDAALLLLKVRRTATQEMKKKDMGILVNILVPPVSDNLYSASNKQHSITEDPEDADTPPSKRIRAVSVDLDYEPKRYKVNRPRILASTGAHTVPPSPPGPKSSAGPAMTHRECPPIPFKSDSKSFVGTKATGPVRDVLLRKFSWKNYPALENYLIEHRAEYLDYSSRFNYTSDQKRYNNDLTQGLLDLAADEGYVFEDFTFAAVRDRIRCYYKSCVQAAKKKRKRR